MRLRPALRIQGFKCSQIQLGTCGQLQAIKLYVLLKLRVVRLIQLIVPVDFPQYANHDDYAYPCKHTEVQGLTTHPVSAGRNEQGNQQQGKSDKGQQHQVQQGSIHHRAKNQGKHPCSRESRPW